RLKNPRVWRRWQAVRDPPVREQPVREQPVRERVAELAWSCRTPAAARAARKAEREPGLRPLAWSSGCTNLRTGNRHRVQSVLKLRYDGTWQRSVVERFSRLLAVLVSPAQKIYQLLALYAVGLILIREDPGHRRDGVRVFARGIDDRHAIVCILRQLHASCRR